MTRIKHLLRDREFERYSAEEEAFEKGDGYTRVIIRMRQNTNSVLQCLRVIQFTLIGIFYVLLVIANKLSPNWWKFW